jgi:hypothetical protein
MAFVDDVERLRKTTVCAASKPKVRQEPKSEAVVRPHDHERDDRRVRCPKCRHFTVMMIEGEYLVCQGFRYRGKQYSCGYKEPLSSVHFRD